MTPEEAAQYVLSLAEHEQWSEKETNEALMDVKDGMDISTPWDTLKSNLAYGMVVSSNDKADRRVAGFPQFGDIVLWKRQRGFDCKAIAKLTRDNSDDTKGMVCSADGKRRASLGDDPPVVLDWKEHIVGIVFKWEEMTGESKNEA